MTGPVLAAVLLAMVLSGEPTVGRRRGLGRTAVGATLGLLSPVALMLYQLHDGHRLPMSNAWLPACVTLVTVGCLWASHRPPEAPARRVEAGTSPAARPGGPRRDRWRVRRRRSGRHRARRQRRSPPVAAQATWRLRVLTSNVEGAVTTSGGVDLATIANLVRDSGADVVFLQEVDRGWPLAGTVDVAGWLQHRLGWEQMWAPAADQQAGNLLLSRVRLTDPRTVRLPRGGGSMDRGATVATVRVSGALVQVIGTRLQHRNSRASMQERQTETAVLLRATAGKAYVVLMGDLNPRNPDPIDLRTLTRHGFTAAQNGYRCVWPTSNRNCSDEVFVGSGLSEVRTAMVLGRPFDHRPVITEIVPATKRAGPPDASRPSSLRRDPQAQCRPAALPAC